ncbi:MAG TPA: hypothetical protein VFS21_00295, partial [Roseiflexaceae bacterium]|nr:hypothetical protein [Roseiflexaceae bacterium]
MLERTLIDVLIDARSRCQNDNDIPKLGAMIKNVLFSSAPKIFNKQGNLNLIDFGPIKDHPFRDTARVIGVVLKHDNLSISSVFNDFEDAPAPKEVLQRFPSLSEQEWSAVLRFCTLVLISLERVIRLPKKRKISIYPKNRWVGECWGGPSPP